MGTIGFLRNYFMSKCFSELFEKTYIISIKNITIPSKDNIPLDFGEIHRVCNYDYRNLMNNFSDSTSDLRKNVNTKSTLVKFFRKFIDSFPMNSLIGEGGFFYILNGTLRGLMLIRKNKINQLYSSFRPIADHIIAFNLKLFFPGIKWIADFRDLPVDNFRKNTFMPAFQLWLMKKLLKKANHVITVSEGLNDNLSKIKPGSKVIRNGFYRLFIPKKNQSKDHFTITYTGSLYSEFRKPDLLFNILRIYIDEGKINENEIKLVYAGKDSSTWNSRIDNYGLKKISIDLGELSLEESVELQVNSHILLLLTWSGNDNTGILTGKLFEYLSSGNPIFALINGSKDEEIEDIFNSYKSGRVFYEEDTESLKSSLMNYYNEWKQNGKIEHEAGIDLQEHFSWEKVKEQIRELI